jgi:hypothetical protein
LPACPSGGGEDKRASASDNAIHCGTNKMKIKQLIAAAIVLAALTATLYWSNHHKPIEDAAKAAANAPVKIISFQKDDISKLEIKRKNGEVIDLSRTSPASWKITSPKPLVGDADTVSTILYAISPLETDRVIEDKASDVKTYGLAEPAVEVSATDKGGKSQQLLVGDDVPTGGSSYAMLAGDPRVFLISSSAKTNFDKGLKDLQDKRLLPVDFNNISKIEIVSKKLNLAFGSKNGQWVMQAPKDVRGDASKLEGVVEKLRLATMDPSAPDTDLKKAASSFSSGTPVATVKAADASGSQQELQVRKNKDDYYAKTTAMDGAFKVTKELGETIDKNLDDFREKRLFDFAESNPEKIEIHSGSKSFFLTRSGEDWWSDGKKMDAVSIDSVIREIRLLSATKFASKGFSSPAASIIVTSNDGKRVEKAEVSKEGNGYIAKRENDPLLYEMDAKVFEDFQKATDELKPAEAPKK